MPVIARLVAIARGSGRSIIYVGPDGVPVVSAEGLAVGRSESDARLLKTMLPRPADPVLARSRPSAFDGSGLDEVLASRGISRVFVVGQVAEGAVLRTVLDGVERGLQVAVAPAALVSLDAADGMAALRMMRRNGVDIRLKAYAAFKLNAADSAEREVSTPGSDAPGRPELLAAFASVMTREGFSGIRVADVAREARVSLRTFYEMFPGGKDECCIALFVQQAEQLERAVVDAARDEAPGDPRIRAGLEAALRRLREHRALVKALLFGLPALGVEADRVRERATDRFVALLMACADGPEPPEPVAARGLVGAVLELSLNDASEVDRESTSSVAATIVAMFGRSAVG